MKLTLTLTTRDPRAAPADMTKAVADGSLRIGRGRDNDWILPDPDRHISKNHCRIDFVGDGYALTDSSTNGVFVNRTGRPVGRGNAVRLNDGDTIRLGNYDFEVSVDGDGAGDDTGYGADFADDADPFDAPPPARDRGGSPMRDDPFPAGDPFSGGDPFGGDFAGLPDRRGGPADEGRFADPDPFATGQPFGQQDLGAPDDPFGPPPAEGPRPVGRDTPDQDDPFGIGPEAEAAAYDPFAEDDRPRRRIDADDPFAGPPPPRQGGAFETAADEAGHEDPLAGSGPSGPVIPEDFDPLADDFGQEAWTGPSEADHLPAEQQSFSVPGSRPGAGPGGAGTGPAGAIPEDWDLADAPDAAASPPEAGRQQAPQRPPPLPPRTDTRSAGAPPATRPEPPAGDPFQAFLAAAGIEPKDMPPEVAEEVMRTVGVLFREMVAGLCEILMVRANIKERFQMTERTTLRRSENNPLKFSVDADDAIANLIVRPRPGFLPADQAVREAMGDIKAHELAVLAGMQTALKALLDRFDPANLEKRIEQTSVWDNILPANRRAKYWELFCEHYREIAREAEDDFHGLFGREFTRAYERQVKRL